MLKISALPQDPEAAEIVKKFMNDRLIRLMERIIQDEVDWTSVFGEGESDEEGTATGGSAGGEIDIDALMKDRNFAENVSMMYLPDNYPIEKANYEFFGLYKLLKAKGEYVPELPMEYILYHIICGEVEQVDHIQEDIDSGMFDEFANDPFFDGAEDEEYTTIEHIPEPERSVVLAALEQEIEEDEDTPEDMILDFEDLRTYGDLCFWDEDFAFLDDMSEEELLNSSFGEMMGISERRDQKVVEFDMEGKNVKLDMTIAPWDMED
ncbi:MAG: hypothetical protein IJ679_07490 [Lachnospiraceae bacterium]|nr:hypothetical protein [Lachnospiraceae bacterium]